MHAGKIETSKRLQMTLDALRQGPKTTRELSEITGSEATHSDIAALRQQLGADVIPRAEYVGTTQQGSKVYRYCAIFNAWMSRK